MEATGKPVDYKLFSILKPLYIFRTASTGHNNFNTLHFKCGRVTIDFPGSKEVSCNLYF